MSRKLEAIAGLAIAGSATLSGIAYGIMGANEGEMPKIMYIIPPLLGLGSFMLGAKPSSPHDRFDPQVGSVYAGFAVGIMTASAGLAYLVEKLTLP